MEINPLNERIKIINNVSELVGRTPLIRINSIGKALKCELGKRHHNLIILVAKCEFFNPGGSIKDRISKRMIIEKMNEGKLKKGGTIIEPTSGNTGIGIALFGAILGFDVVLVVPTKNSPEKIKLMRALGARVVETPADVDHDSPESNINVAKRLQKKMPGSIILNQVQIVYLHL